MSNVYFPRVGSSRDSFLPFQIVESNAVGEGGSTESGYRVSDGVCFSTFNFSTGSFIPIKNLNKTFPFGTDEKFYLEFTITSNLQVSGAEIKCTKVGNPEGESPAPTNVWSNYPNMIRIQPEDEFDEKGRVIRITDGKRQLTCYVLIGYRSDDKFKNGDEQLDEGGGANQEEDSTPIQILNSNLILLASMYSGVPIIFPVPYLDGLRHLQAVQVSTGNTGT